MQPKRRPGNKKGLRVIDSQAFWILVALQGGLASKNLPIKSTAWEPSCATYGGVLLVQ